MPCQLKLSTHRWNLHRNQALAVTPRWVQEGCSYICASNLPLLQSSNSHHGSNLLAVQLHQRSARCCRGPHSCRRTIFPVSISIGGFISPAICCSCDLPDGPFLVDQLVILLTYWVTPRLRIRSSLSPKIPAPTSFEVLQHHSPVLLSAALLSWPSSWWLLSHFQAKEIAQQLFHPAPPPRPRHSAPSWREGF